MPTRYLPKPHLLSAWRLFAITLCTLGALASMISRSSPGKQVLASEKLENSDNVVLITLDTVRADHLHCYGNQNIKTPVIDALAKNGVLFEKAVTQTPLTEPSHASIFT